jgi:hypothetical protein
VTPTLKARIYLLKTEDKSLAGIFAKREELLHWKNKIQAHQHNHSIYMCLHFLTIGMRRGAQ